MSTATLYYLLYTALLGGLVILLTKRSYKSRAPTLANLNGPPPSSWLVGNLQSFIGVNNVGDAESGFVTKYGLAFKMNGIYNRDILYLADPKAIQYVLNSGYTFHKKKLIFLFRLITGPSLIAVEGKAHARQRKILLPGFSQKILKEFVPLFIQKAEKVTGKWRDIVHEEGSTSPVIDIYSWLSRLTLDAIGQGAFSYDFGALNDGPNEFIESYRNLTVDMFHKPTDMELAARAIFGYLPLWSIPIIRLLPARGMKRLTRFQDSARQIALRVVQREMRALEGQLPSGKDVMSSLVRANMSENPKTRMSDEELLSQMMALIFAGHDTTSGTMVWVFYELSRHPDVQRKLRDEIRNTRAAATVSGTGHLDATELESMPYATAVIKETLRYYPIAGHNARTAGRDELIPLSNPVKTASGEEVSAIPVKENQSVLISIWAYNRIRSLWGNDATEWNPERFLAGSLSGRSKNSLGVYANLATFSSGVHSCIGWRFAVLEMKAVLITLIENFQFSPPPNNPTILQASAPTLIPMIQGQECRGAQMPLTITPID